MISFKKIGTHNGVFHCDEVLGCYMLKLLSPDASIVRSRDRKDLDVCDIVIDVGEEYDPSRNRFDHHQRDFNHSMKTLVPGKQWETKLSSAGLVYCHFGKDILTKIMGKLDENLLNSLYDKIYEEFIQEVDGIDNGIPMFNGEPRYRITTNLSSRIKLLNKAWNQKDFDETMAFNKAMALAGSELTEKVKYIAEVWWPARNLVMEAIDNRFKTDPSGEIIELTHFCPWEKHLPEIEKEMDVSPSIKFVIFQDLNSNWRVQGVPIHIGSFELRLPLLEKWCGIRNEELLTVSGIEGIIFVHSTGFIGGNKTKQGVLEMAKQTLLNNKE